MTDRRDFLKVTGAATAALTLEGALRRSAAAQPAAPRQTMDAATRDLLMAAINAAQLGGASYADARVQRQQQNLIFTREQQITNVVDTDTLGCGVRALVDGCWGFAATPTLTTEGVTRAAREAVAVARANRVARDQSVELAPARAHPNATWQSDFQVDPWDISLEEKTDLLLRANAAAMGVAGVRFVNSGLFLIRDERNYANTEGSVINQRFIRTSPNMTITAVAPDFSDFQNRGNVRPPMGRGWEYILECDLVGNAPRWAEEAVAKLSARPVDVGRYDLILHPSHLWLTIHESIGHPTELDRAMGYEANYAGTSFLAPPRDVLGSLKYGPEFMQIQGDRSQSGALSTMGYDDEGVQPSDFMIVKDGMFNDYQTTREQANWLRWWYDRQGEPTRSHGCSYAQNWSSVQFQRMPNVSLMPGEANIGWDDIIADTERGIAIIGDGSFSIDQQRYNAQFGGQLFYEVRNGQIVGQLKDVAYQMRTTDFWNSMDMIGGAGSYELHGSFNDGKGQPGQSNAVSHGSVPARFRQINVINTGRRS
jgi:TldD protein